MNIRKIQRIFAPLLQPLAYPYAYFARTRRELYASGRKKSFKPRSVTISVGNIAAGGTGKTPLTSWILNWAQKQEYETVVLTRGYGGKSGSCPVVVSSDTKPAQCGDEPLLLARKHPGATVIAFPKRRVSMELAERFLEPDLVVLDDGMQHLAIERDIDLVVLKENDLDKGWNKVIPAGEWREDMSALEVADAFFIKADPQKFAELEPLLQNRIGSLQKPVFPFELAVTGLRRVYGFSRECLGKELARTIQAESVHTDQRQRGPHVFVSESPNSVIFGAELDTPESSGPGVLHAEPSGSELFSRKVAAEAQAQDDFIPLSHMKDMGDYILVSGVGEPRQVIETATISMGRAPKETFCYPDHHSYSTNDVKNMESHKLPIVCTEKDAVKLEQFILSVPFYALDVAVKFGPACMTDKTFEHWLNTIYAQMRGEHCEQQDAGESLEVPAGAPAEAATEVSTEDSAKD